MRAAGHGLVVRLGILDWRRDLPHRPEISLIPFTKREGTYKEEGLS
jgi:hypothetical protein